MDRTHHLPAVQVSDSTLLLPEQLEAKAADAVRELLAEAAAANTTRSYATALRYWAGWYQARFGSEMTLPVSEVTVIQFLVDHIVRKNKLGMVCELPAGRSPRDVPLQVVSLRRADQEKRSAWRATASDPSRACPPEAAESGAEAI